eukprot:CAMPEP_0168317888 /NCGR_PEP_ID=MMETSP0213-20121227/152_1 /TAXON_ID=151035 /ORGANISM="Euplotes harpa, Strain FSP1.4" /LENGTH=40 /DNA_ID= /DNA_START= /DNA_END= /DNA_ORIENTATION=
MKLPCGAESDGSAAPNSDNRREARFELPKDLEGEQKAGRP